MIKRASGGARLVVSPSLLPRVAAIDGGVLMRALEPGHTDRFAAACRDFVEAMEKAPNAEVLVPAPVFAEFLLGAVSPLPRTPRIIVVPFDQKAAEILANRLPSTLIKAEGASQRDGVHPHLPGAYFKYDAMIVACAIRWEAKRIISIDRHVRSLAKKAGIEPSLPDAFYDKQLSLGVPTAEPEE